MAESKSFNWIKGENFGVRIEYNEFLCILHLPFVDRLNKTTYLEICACLEDIWLFMKTIGFEALHTAVDPNNLKIKKLLSKLNFKCLGNFDSLDVYEFKGA